MQVEDVTLKAQEGLPQTFRRMVFASTPNLIQSEACLVPAASTPASHGNLATARALAQGNVPPDGTGPLSHANGTAAHSTPNGNSTAGKGKSKSQKCVKQKKKSPPKAAAAAPGSVLGGAGGSEVGGELVVDSSRLACAYHHQILAGLPLIGTVPLLNPDIALTVVGS